MWSLAKIFKTPEVTKVSVGSFWEEPLRHAVFREIYEREQRDLLDDMASLPATNAVRKLNDLIKRAKLARV